ncbi:mitochondrial ribonuclease P protein 1 -like protein [Asbolus verrucosus]|uniref:RNA (guanine-9-)-methyltransferase domain-containing protein 1 n=1 Tax=Asbolus verrucosus TaxID=1661398 RepID=A0A482WCE5_ASBVE|nr:mitochondrial ribonuclease P protein 1 -like protein [Asbolus verrucosus]
MFNIINNLSNFVRLESLAQGPNIPLITNGDKDLEHKLKVLILEMDVMRQEGKLVPDDCHLKDKDWQELLNLPTISARRRFLEFLFKVSKKKEHQKAREDETFEEFVSQYDLQHNNIFLRFYDTTINQLYNNRLIQAMQFGQKLVVDCGYDEQMTARENKNCAKQLMLLFAENRNHDATMYEPWFPLNLHESSYLEKFPKERLIYLTPHCREELLEYDHDAIYIIGGIVDMMNNQPLSLAKAKKEGVRMAKLPLDRYLQWGSGSGKNLTLNQVASILLDVKVTGDWKYALRHVPKRKIVDYAQKDPIEQYKRKWSPSDKINFGKLSFNRKNDRERMLKVRSIMYD